MSDLKDRIYNAIFAEYGAGGQFLWEDLVRPTDLRGINLESKTLQRAAEISQRELLASYVGEACPGFVSGSGLAIGEHAYTSYMGTLGDALVDMILVSTEDYNSDDLHKKLAIPAAAKAYLKGYKRVELVQFDRDKQDWSWFTVSGDFSSAFAWLEGEIKEDIKVLRLNDLRVTPNLSLNVKLDSYLWSLNKKETGRQKNCIHPSEITTSECDRKIAYGLIGESGTENVDPKLRRIFDVGHVYHDIVQAALSWMSPGFRFEVPANVRDLKISGHCDGVDDVEGMEIKTIGRSGFQKLTRPKPDHIAQATIYAAALNLEWLNYIYICKEDSNIAVFREPIDKGVWHRVASRAEAIVSIVADGDLPNQINKLSVCRSCKYSRTCRPELHPPDTKRMFQR